MKRILRPVSLRSELSCNRHFSSILPSSLHYKYRDNQTAMVHDIPELSEVPFEAFIKHRSEKKFQLTRLNCSPHTKHPNRVIPEEWSEDLI